LSVVVPVGDKTTPPSMKWAFVDSGCEGDFGSLVTLDRLIAVSMEIDGSEGAG